MDKNLSRTAELANKILANKPTLQIKKVDDLLQSQQQATLLHLETVFTNISDNIYNIGGIFKAQLTSMEETKQNLKQKYQNEKLRNIEKKIEEKKRFDSKEIENKIILEKLDSKFKFEDILSDLGKMVEASYSGYELFDHDRKQRNQRKENKKSSQVKIKSKFDPVLKLGGKFVKKIPFIGIVLTVGEGLYKTLEEDEEVTEARGGPLASFVYNTADALVTNITFGLLDMKILENSKKVLSENDEGKKILQKNKDEIVGASSKFDFVSGNVSSEESIPPKLPTSPFIKTRSLSAQETQSTSKAELLKNKTFEIKTEEKYDSITLDELIGQKNKQYSNNIVVTESGEILVDSQGVPVGSSSLDELIEQSLKKETTQAPPFPAPTPAKPAAAPSPVSKPTVPTPATPAAAPSVTPSAPIPTPPAPPPTPVSKPSPGVQGILGGIIETIKQAGITSYTAISNILSQIKSETNFKLQSENLNYSSAEQIQRVFGKRRFPTLESAQPYVKNPIALANYAYKNTDGNSQEGDGWKYRGRGWIQHTGKAQYEAISKYAGVDLISNPDLLNDPIIASKALMWFFFNYKKLKPNDLEDISKVNRAIGFSDPTGKKAELRAQEALAFQTKFESGQELNEISGNVKAAKKQPQGTTVVNVDNSINSAVKMQGAPQGGFTVVPKPVMI